MRLIKKIFIFIIFMMAATAVTLSVRVRANFNGDRMMRETKAFFIQGILAAGTKFAAPRLSAPSPMISRGMSGEHIIMRLCVKMINSLFAENIKDLIIWDESLDANTDSDILNELIIENQLNNQLNNQWKNQIGEPENDQAISGGPAGNDYQNDFGVGEILENTNDLYKPISKGEEEEEPYIEDPAGEDVENEVIALVKENFLDFKDLYDAFYVLDASTTADGSLLNIHELLETDMRLKTGNDVPQILIYHTHSQEGFLDSILGDASTSVVAVGDALTAILTNTYGYNVIHLKESFDLPDRNKAYANSEPYLTKFLRENPTIEVIIDLHRDGVAEDKHYVTNINGRPIAQFMFFNGLSKTKRDGEIDYLPNPNIKGNLAFSFQMQWAANALYPGLTRKIYLKGYRYNMHFREKSLLIELGGQTNTFEEALNTAEPIARLLNEVLG